VGGGILVSWPGCWNLDTLQSSGMRLARGAHPGNRAGVWNATVHRRDNARSHHSSGRHSLWADRKREKHTYRSTITAAMIQAAESIAGTLTYSHLQSTRSSSNLM